MKMTNMNKAGGNAAWNKLPVVDRKKLEDWLLDGGFSIRQVLEKARQELGFAGSMASLQRFHQRLSQARVLADFSESLAHVQAIEGATVTAEQLRNASMKVMAQALLQQVTTAPEHVRQWAWLAKLLLHSEENDIRRRALAEGHELQRERLQLARTRFEFDAVEEAYEALPALQSLERSRKSSKFSRIERAGRMLAVRTLMFGRIVRDRYRTDDPKERAAIDAVCDRIVRETHAEREREAARKKALDEALEKFETEQQQADEREAQEAEASDDADADETTEDEGEEDDNDEDETDEADGTESDEENPETNEAADQPAASPEAASENRTGRDETME